MKIILSIEEAQALICERLNLPAGTKITIARRDTNKKGTLQQKIDRLPDSIRPVLYAVHQEMQKSDDRAGTFVSTKINAIKILRQATQSSLIDAKNAVESFEDFVDKINLAGSWPSGFCGGLRDLAQKPA